MIKLGRIAVMLILVSIIAIQPVLASTAMYQVVKGDTLWRVAHDHKISLEKLQELNPGVSAANLAIGQKLIVAEGQDRFIYHQVQKGDTLTSLARQYHVPAQVLAEVNKLTNNRISRGQVIAIPVADPDKTVPYYVKAGDTLYALANKYQTSVANLRQLNFDLKPENLEVGMRLFIPARQVHVVKSGDTLNKIADHYSVPIQRLLQWNNFSEIKPLQIGQKLIVEL